MTSYNGTLWIVKKDMCAQHEYNEYVGNRNVVIQKGEIFEWRFESPMHFRTMDDKWFKVSEEIMLKHCLKIGMIDEKVHFKNKAKTEEIWRLELFSWTENGREVYRQITEQFVEEDKDE